MSSTPPSEYRNQLIVGDAATELARIPAESIDCVVTSPPYYRLRDYQSQEQLGHEPSIDDWVDELNRPGFRGGLVY